jgi:hypothetical protein
MGMVLVCAWCGKFMGMKDPASRPAISHGICLACSARQVWRDSPTLVVSRARRRVAPVLEELLHGTPKVHVVIDRRHQERRAPTADVLADAERRVSSDRRQGATMLLA